ncbi:hypothetical protein D3C84_730210 [compost metagenome]
MFAFPFVAADKLARGDAGLDPAFTGGQFPVGRQARQFCAGTGPAGRAVVGLARAHDEVAAVGVIVVGKQFDVVDQRAVFTVDALGLEGLEHCPGVLGEELDVVHLQGLTVIGHQEKPVAAPGDVAVHAAMSWHFDRHLLAVAVGGHVAQGDVAVLMQRGADRADRRIDLVLAGLDMPQVMQRVDQADGAVTAHAEVAGVVEEDHAAGGIRRHRFAVQRTHQHIVATGLQQAGATPLVMLLAQGIALLGHGPAGQLGQARHHQASRLAAGVGINDMYFFHKPFH